MGKVKQKRGSKGRTNPTGLLSMEECVMLDESTAVEVGSTVSNLVEKLQHAHEEERNLACMTIAGLVSEPGAVAQLMSAKAIRILGPLILDAHSNVREAALGALRNISVEGGVDVVKEMILQDILTPLTTFFKEYGENWTLESKSEKQLQKDEKYVSFLQAVHLLLNACEASEVAVEIFNRERLLFLLLPCLSVPQYGIELATAVAQCLVTASENNSDCCSLLGQEEMMSVLLQMLDCPHTNTQELLFRTIIAELVFSCVRCGSGKHVNLESLAKVLKEVLHQGIVDSITNAVQTISTSEGNGSEEASAADTNEDKTPSKQTAAILKDLTDACAAQQIGLEILSNMCTSGEEDDEGWEDVESIGSEEDMMEAEVDAQDATLNQESASEIMASLQKYEVIPQVFSLVSALCSFDSSIFSKDLQLKKLAACVSDLKNTGLLCINNLISCGDAVINGEILGNFWRQISQMATLPNVQNESDLMEALTCAMRAAAGKLAEGNASVFMSMTPEDMQFLSSLALQCPSNEVQANAIRIIGTIGTVMVKTNPGNPVLKDIGILLGECASSDKELWVVAESLDAIMDVFGPDETDPILKEIGLIAKLKILAPVLKRKVQQQRPSKEHLPVISTVRMNLTRFIKYKAHTIT